MAEFAIVSARRHRLQTLAEHGDTRAGAALELAAEPNRFLSTVQIGITVIGVLSGAYGGAVFATGLAEFVARSRPSRRTRPRSPLPWSCW